MPMILIQTWLLLHSFNLKTVMAKISRIKPPLSRILKLHKTSQLKSDSFNWTRMSNKTKITKSLNSSKEMPSRDLLNAQVAAWLVISLTRTTTEMILKRCFLIMETLAMQILKERAKWVRWWLKILRKIKRKDFQRERVIKEVTSVKARDLRE